MSKPISTPAPAGSAPSGLKRPQGDTQPSAFAVQRSWKIGLLVAMIMILLGLLGVGLTTANAAVAPTYWVSLVPIYGILCVFTAYTRAGIGRIVDRSAVVRQIFHWLGIAAALGLDFYVRGTGQENGVAAGLNALLLLALGCYLAGVHLEWPFAVVGLLLSVTLIFVAEADEYLWLILLIGTVALIAMVFMMRFFGGSSESKTVDAASSGETSS
jgi:hypothetical protein